MGDLPRIGCDQIEVSFVGRVGESLAWLWQPKSAIESAVACSDQRWEVSVMIDRFWRLAQKTLQIEHHLKTNRRAGAAIVETKREWSAGNGWGTTLSSLSFASVSSRLHRWSTWANVWKEKKEPIQKWSQPISNRTRSHLCTGDLL